jgi:uncharacterized membrane protein (DUF106 family)
MTMADIFVALLALAFSAMTFYANKKLVDRRRLDEIKREVNRFQKEYGEARKSGDEEKLRQLEKRNEEVLGMTKEMMLMQFKPSLVTFPLFFVFSFVVKQPPMNAASISLPFALPVPDLARFTVQFRSSFGPLGEFILLSIFFAMLFELAFTVQKKLKSMKK